MAQEVDCGLQLILTSQDSERNRGAPYLGLQEGTTRDSMGNNDRKQASKSIRLVLDAAISRFWSLVEGLGG